MKRTIAIMIIFVLIFPLTPCSHAMSPEKEVPIFMDMYGEALLTLPHQSGVSLKIGELTSTPQQSTIRIGYCDGLWEIELNEETMKVVLRDSYPPNNATLLSYPPGTLDIGALIAHAKCIEPSPSLGANWSY